MHPAAYNAIARMLEGVPVAKKHILELGSFNVNGSVRPLFADATRYDGLDSRPGPDVDIVADGRTWKPKTPYDIVVTCETLEHTDDPQSLLATAQAALKPGGLLLLTAASPERTPHGIDGGALGGEVYTAIAPDALAEWLGVWEDVKITHNPSAGDVYASARKPAK